MGGPGGRGGRGWIFGPVPMGGLAAPAGSCWDAANVSAPRSRLAWPGDASPDDDRDLVPDSEITRSFFFINHPLTEHLEPSDASCFQRASRPDGRPCDRSADLV